MAYSYLVNGIVWAVPSAGLPLDSTVMLSKHLVESGCEGHEPQAFYDAVEKMTEDEQEAFWNAYEASAAAEAAWDAEWESAIKDALEAKHGATVQSFGGFEPALAKHVAVCDNHIPAHDSARASTLSTRRGHLPSAGTPPFLSRTLT